MVRNRIQHSDSLGNNNSLDSNSLVLKAHTSFRLYLYLFAIGIGYLLVRPIDDLDLFTQITLGSLSWSSRALVTHEPFSYLLNGDLIANPGWVAQLLFYGLYSTGGWELLRVAYAALFSLAFLIVLSSDQRHDLQTRSPSSLASMLAFLLALTVVGSNTSIRPQGISLLCFALLMMLRSSPEPLPKRLMLFLPVALLWQNSHLSLSLGILWLIIHTISLLRSQPGPEHRTVIHESLSFLMVAVICFFLTPEGIGVIALSARGASISHSLLGISEWMPPWHPIVRDAMSGFWLALLFTFYMAIKIPGSVLNSRNAPFFVFLVLSLSSARFSLYFALVALPFWRQWFDATLVSRFRVPPFSFSQIPHSRHLFLLPMVMLTALTPLLLVPSLEPSLPISEAQHLLETVKRGRVYNYREWGGILTFVGFPEFSIGLDGRLYNYSDEMWHRYHQEALGEVTISEITARYHPDAFFLHRTFHQKLIEQLQEDSQWSSAGGGNSAVVFIKALP